MIDGTPARLVMLISMTAVNQFLGAYSSRYTAPATPTGMAATAVTTITSFIVQVALGDLPHGSIGYQTIFAAGLTLLLMTLLFNILGHFLTRKYRQVY